MFTVGWVLAFAVASAMPSLFPPLFALIASLIAVVLGAVWRITAEESTTEADRVCSAQPVRTELVQEGEKAPLPPSLEKNMLPTANTKGGNADDALARLRTILDEHKLSQPQSYFCTDATLLRYLEASSHDVSRAYARILNTLKWRAEKGLEYRPMFCSGCEEDEDNHCFFGLGMDRRGLEVMYCCPGRARVKDPESSLLHMFKALESVFEGNALPGKIAWMIDLHGMGWRDLDPRTGSGAVPVLANHYPERLAQVCLLDSPAIFKFAWSGIQPLLDPVTANKVMMLRGDDMTDYFTEHLTPKQTEFMEKVLKMPATPGSYPEVLKFIRRPVHVAAPPP